MIVPMKLYNTTHYSIYNEWPAQKQNIMTSWLDKSHTAYWSFITQFITIFTTIYTYTHIHLLNQQINDMKSYQSTRESRSSHLHPQSNTRIQLLPRKSRIHCKVKSASNVQRYNPAPLILLANSHWLIVPGHTPNVHLLPSGNANDQKKSICDLPFFAT